MKHQYAPVGQAEDGSTEDRTPMRLKSTKPKTQLLILSVVAIISFTMGYIGRPYLPQGFGDRSGSQAAPAVALGHVDVLFDLAEDFNTIPVGNESEPAWDSLLPLGVGVVKDESLSPKTSMISAIHQLHCLNLLRRGFFSSSGDKMEAFDLGVERKSHAAHCFDYLRQAIMCNADSTLEPFKMDVHGKQGWGITHRCRDYEQLKSWAEGARLFDAHGFMAEGFPQSQ